MRGKCSTDRFGGDGGGSSLHGKCDCGNSGAHHGLIADDFPFGDGAALLGRLRKPVFQDFGGDDALAWFKGECPDDVSLWVRRSIRCLD